MNRVTIRYAAMSRQIAEESSTRVSLPGSFAGTQSVGHTPAIHSSYLGLSQPSRIAQILEYFEWGLEGLVMPLPRREEIK